MHPKESSTQKAPVDEPDVVRIALISTEIAEIDHLRSMLEDPAYEVSQRHMADSGAVVLDDSIDVHIICQPRGFHILDVADKPI